MNDYFNNLKSDPVKLKQFLRRVMAPDRRTICGPEREHLLLVFKLVEATDTSNNQRSITEVYEHADKLYNVTYFDDETIVEEILIDNDI